MNRRSYPVGQTSTALLKALLRTLSSERGAAAADSWLRAIRMVRDDLADETRPVPLGTVHRALVVFAEVGSRDLIVRASRELVARDNLGAWVRVLRGTTAPIEAFDRLDAADGPYARTTRWETTAAANGRWRGRVFLAHDPSLEEDGLLRLARLAELAAVPALFGYPDARARSVADGAAGAPSPGGGGGAGGGLAQSFEVEWSVPSVAATGALGGGVGVVVGVAPVLARAMPWQLGAAVVAVSAATGALLGRMRARDLVDRAEAHAQQTRVLALERSLSLREARESEVGAQLEGSVVAGQYRIVRRLGAGATGVIYEALRMSDGASVAIKLLRAAAAHEAVASDRLRREAEALGLSWHPNVVEVLDHGHLSDGTAYLVMELLNGESLASRLRARGRLAPEEVLPIARQVGAALTAMHAAGVVHRDLKPSNIYLTVDRDDPAGPERVKLLDFGIARVEWEETRITNTGGPLGTPGYMAPEQESGEREIDGRADIYSLGVVLLECLVGEPPPARSSGAVRMLPPPGGTPSSGALPPAWLALLRKATARDPAERFQDARALLDALLDLAEPVTRVEASS
jgi:serine/threonine-protein kinase